jgi:hypothetical protein
MNIVHIIALCLSNVNINIIYPSAPKYPLQVSELNFVLTSHLPYVLHILNHPLLLYWTSLIL